MASTSTLALLLGAAPLAVPASAEAPPSVAAPLVVRLDAGVEPAEQAAVLAEAGLTLVDRLPGSDFALAVADAGTTTSEAGAAAGIADIDPIVTYRAFGVPNDPAYRVQWHLPAIDAASAWDVTTGEGTIVAVIDTGVAYETTGPYVQAPDLAGTSFVPGWDFVGGDSHPNDENGHGTHVAGSIAESTNNGLGGAGAAPGVSIMPLRVLDAAGAGTDFHVAQAIRFAADHGAAVANLSLGGRSQSNVVRDAITYATNQGTVVVAAAGNEGASTVSYPAAYERAIAVGAVRYDLTRPAYGNHGTGLDLVAPGGDLSVDQNGDGIFQETFRGGFGAFCLCAMQGTSMAAPQVSAVAALVASRGVTDVDVVRQVLTATAVDLGAPGWDEQYGDGLVQAGAAVRADLPVDGATAEPVVEEPAAEEPVVEEPAPAVGTGAPRSFDLACPADSTPEAGFADLTETVHAAGITCAAWWGVASGRTATSFDPAGAVTRGQLASFVARALEASGLELPVSPPDAFADDEGSVHEARIDQLAVLGVVSGRADGTYAPGAVVTRAEMATFLARAHDVVSALDLAAGPNRFVDDDDSVHAVNIDRVAAAGLAGGTSASTFAPSAPVQRGQMATFLARSIDLLIAEGTTAPR